MSTKKLIQACDWSFETSSLLRWMLDAHVYFKVICLDAATSQEHFSYIQEKKDLFKYWSIMVLLFMVH